MLSKLDHEIFYETVVSLITWCLFAFLVIGDYVKAVWQVMHLLNVQSAYTEIPVVIIVPAAIAMLCATFSYWLIARFIKWHTNSTRVTIAARVTGIFALAQLVVSIGSIIGVGDKLGLLIEILFLLSSIAGCYIGIYLVTKKLSKSH